MVPIAAMIRGMERARNPMQIVGLLYSLLPLPLAFAGLTVFPPLADPAAPHRRRKLARLLGLCTIGFLPGYFLVFSVVAWANEQAIFFLAYLAVVVGSYMAWLILGLGVLVSLGAKALDARPGGLAALLDPQSAEPAEEDVSPSAQPETPAATPDEASVSDAAAPDAAERLRQLKQLLDESLISEDEYEQKRAEIIADL